MGSHEDVQLGSCGANTLQKAQESIKELQEDGNISELFKQWKKVEMHCGRGMLEWKEMTLQNLMQCWYLSAQVVSDAVHWVVKDLEDEVSESTLDNIAVQISELWTCVNDLEDDENWRRLSEYSVLNESVAALQHSWHTKKLAFWKQSCSEIRRRIEGATDREELAVCREDMANFSERLSETELFEGNDEWKGWSTFEEARVKRSAWSMNSKKSGKSPTRSSGTARSMRW